MNLCGLSIGDVGFCPLGDMLLESASDLPLKMLRSREAGAR